ncbi:MAG: PEGA domain-containing protein [Methanoregulaceae archaeon]|nr:PEGA domain-containing protein [Methanoregulaceae archaeon]
MKETSLIILLIFLAAGSLSGLIPYRTDAADVGGIVLPDYHHIDITMAHGGGTKYVKFDGGGINALHMTTTPSEPYGQVTMTDAKSGTFYLSDTGGRGFSDDLILMVAVQGDVPDDYQVRIRASGYQWTPTPVLNQPPSAGDITYTEGSVDDVFGKEDFIYGLQSWKPYSGEPYPIYSGQDMNDPTQKFRFAFIDLRAGLLGPNSNLTNLIDDGMVRVEYEIEGGPAFTVFNTYGWCNQSNQGRGISWTNDVTNEGTGASGYSVKTTREGGDQPPAVAGGGIQVEETIQGSSGSQYGGSTLTPSTFSWINGTVSLTRIDAGSAILKGQSSTEIQLPSFAMNLSQASGRISLYAGDGREVSSGRGVVPDFSVSVDGDEWKAGEVFRDQAEDGSGGISSTHIFTGEFPAGSSRHSVRVKSNGASDTVCTLYGGLLTAIMPASPPGSAVVWIDDGCDIIQAAKGSDPDSATTTAQFGAVPRGLRLQNATLVLSGTGPATQAGKGNAVLFNGKEMNGSFTGSANPEVLTFNVTGNILPSGNTVTVQSIPGEGPGRYLENRNAILTLEFASNASPASQTASLPVEYQVTSPRTVTTSLRSTAPTVVTQNLTAERSTTADPLSSIPDPFRGILEMLLDLISGPTQASSGNQPPTDQLSRPAPDNPAPLPAAKDGKNQDVSGALTIISDPSGAEIVLDGVSIGQTTPFTATGITEGAHTIRIELHGYDPSGGTLIVRGNTTVELPLNMSGTALPIQSPEAVPAGGDDSGIYGGISIDSLPEGAAITLDGRKLDAVTPYVVYGLKEGLHTVRLSHDRMAFPVSSKQVWVYKGMISGVTFTQSTAVARSFTIESDDFSGEEFTLNGHFPSYRIPTVISFTETGSFITFSHDRCYISRPISDFLNTGDTVTIRDGEPLLAGVRVISEPPGADILVDGFPTGEKTPCLVRNLSEGKHVIALSALGFIPVEQEVSLMDDPTKETDAEIILPMSTYPYGELKVTSMPSGAQIYLDGANTYRTTPWTFRYRSIGSYSLRVAQGQRSQTIDLTILPDTVREYKIDLVNDTFIERKYPTGSV